MKTIDKTLNEEKINQISKIKNEPSWMKSFRLKAFEKFEQLDQPNFGPLFTTGVCVTSLLSFGISFLKLSAAS